MLSYLSAAALTWLPSDVPDPGGGSAPRGSETSPRSWAGASGLLSALSSWP